MIGLVVKDMEKSVEFYRRLGLELPEESEKSIFVPVKMGELTFFLSTREQNNSWDPNNTPVTDNGYKMILEFYLKRKEEVDKKYNELIKFGYQSHLKPYITAFNMYFAVIKDPDGNQILLSGEV